MNHEWTKGSEFVPAVGRCYEITFGNIEHEGKIGRWTAKVRVEGLDHNAWIDIDTGSSLDADFTQYSVQAYRVIDC